MLWIEFTKKNNIKLKPITACITRLKNPAEQLGWIFYKKESITFEGGHFYTKFKDEMISTSK